LKADFKINGLPFAIISEIVQKSKKARIKILDLMNKEILKHKETQRPNHPVIKNFNVTVEQRAKFIGPGGINLKRIQSKTGITITTNDEFNFTLFAPNQNALDEAEEIIKTVLDHKVYLYF
jgi:polyribonucleotide nucleotidyltransferase